MLHVFQVLFCSHMSVRVAVGSWCDEHILVSGTVLFILMIMIMIATGTTLS